MCRSIKQLRQANVAASEAEIRAAALQFVRKVSGYRAPSRSNQAAFNKAVDEITSITQILLIELQVNERHKTSLAQTQMAKIPDPNQLD